MSFALERRTVNFVGDSKNLFKGERRGHRGNQNSCNRKLSTKNSELKADHRLETLKESFLQCE